MCLVREPFFPRIHSETMLKYSFLRFACAALLVGCVETELVPDPPAPPVRPTLSLSPRDTAVFVGQTYSLRSRYVNESGQLASAPIVWASNQPSIATVSNSGVVSTLLTGQVVFTATANDMVVGFAQVTVVNQNTSVANVLISPALSTLAMGANASLTATAFTITNQVVAGAVTWASSQTNVATVSPTGFVNALSVGTTMITATVAGVSSVPLALTVTSGERVASITPGPVPGDASRGTARLVRVNGGLELRFDSDFTSNSGPGLYVYLANCNLITGSNSGSCQRVELGSLKSTQGQQTYAVPSSVGINDYSHVLVHCRPFVITFGSGRLN
jgi:uncharacterized protein YjdB